jgi:DNA-binding MarR family transcriptional regulator
MQSRFSELDPIIHSRVRLAIMVLLLNSKSASFTYLKKEIAVSDGNLSSHLSKLESVDYINIRKHFMHKKPVTVISLTDKGRDALEKYTDNLEGYFAFMEKHKK